MKSLNEFINESIFRGSKHPADLYATPQDCKCVADVVIQFLSYFDLEGKTIFRTPEELQRKLSVKDFRYAEGESSVLCSDFADGETPYTQELVNWIKEHAFDKLPKPHTYKSVKHSAMFYEYRFPDGVTLQLTEVI
jgi:hypothetical protein